MKRCKVWHLVAGRRFIVSVVFSAEEPVIHQIHLQSNISAELFDSLQENIFLIPPCSDSVVYIFLRSLPVDVLIDRPDQEVGPRQDRHRVVHGSRLGLHQPGRPEQREELQQEQSLRPEQAGQRALHALAG